MSCRLPVRIPSRARWAIFSLLLLISITVSIPLVGCSFEAQPLPTLLASAPTVSPSPTGLPSREATQAPDQANLGGNAAGTPVVSATPESRAAPAASPTLRSTSTPTPYPTGIRPGQAAYQRPPEVGPESTIEWRPPPLAAPFSLHPDDHYWLARPLPSDSRNYDLEVYPFGNIPVPQYLRPYRVHHGMDFPNDKGTPIFAAGSGTVVFAGPRPNPINGINYYGNTVIILHDWQWQGQDVYTLYAHTLELFVEVGDQVEQGQLIAGVGNSGEVSGPHLHFEVRIGSNHYDSVVNPGLWLVPFEGWGTLAGRFVDNRGLTIHGAHVTLRPVSVASEVGAETMRHLTYSLDGIQSDANWDENFLFSDIPAGEYLVEIRTAGLVYKRNVEVRPGMTSFIVVQAEFAWEPTATPTDTPTPTPTPTSTGTITPTATSTPTPTAVP